MKQRQGWTIMVLLLSFFLLSAVSVHSFDVQVSVDKGFKQSIGHTRGPIIGRRSKAIKACCKGDTSKTRQNHKQGKETNQKDQQGVVSRIVNSLKYFLFNIQQEMLGERDYSSIKEVEHVSDKKQGVLHHFTTGVAFLARELREHVQKQISQVKRETRGNDTAVFKGKETGTEEPRYHLPTPERREAEDEIQNIDTVHNTRGQHNDRTGNRYLSQREAQRIKDKTITEFRKKKQRSLGEKKRLERKKNM